MNPFKTAAALLLLGMPGGMAIAADEVDPGIAKSIEEVRSGEREETGRDAYLIDKYLDQETTISRTPHGTVIGSVDVIGNPEPEPFDASNLDEPLLDDVK